MNENEKARDLPVVVSRPLMHAVSRAAGFLPAAEEYGACVVQHVEHVEQQRQQQLGWSARVHCSAHYLSKLPSGGIVLKHGCRKVSVSPCEQSCGRDWSMSEFKPVFLGPPDTVGGGLQTLC